jgi:hypothetical protein
LKILIPLPGLLAGVTPLSRLLSVLFLGANMWKREKIEKEAKLIN